MSTKDERWLRENRELRRKNTEMREALESIEQIPWDSPASAQMVTHAHFALHPESGGHLRETPPDLPFCRAQGSERTACILRGSCDRDMACND